MKILPTRRAGGSASVDEQMLAWQVGAPAPAADGVAEVVADETGKVPLSARSFSLGRKRVKAGDVAWMLDKLAKTQTAGLPMFRALGMLAGMRRGTPMGEVLSGMQAKMAEGVGLGAAMREHQDIFGELVCALIESGEVSGSLDTSLAKAAALTSSRLRLRRKIRSAMVYPMSVIVITTGLIAVLLTYVVPKFTDIYAQAGSELPALTKALVAASKYAPLVLAVLAALTAAGVVLARRSRTDDRLGMALDTFKLRLPVLGSLIAKGVDARIAATLAHLLAAGVPLLETLTYAADAAGNRVYAAALDRVRVAVGDGATLTGALSAEPVFPEMLVQLAGVGEETGALPDLMEQYAVTAEEEVEQAAETLTSLIEPAMMVIIGGIVGVFLIGLYMPIIQLSDQIK